MASNVFLIYCFLLVYSGGATSGLIILFLMEFLSWIFLMILEKFSSLKYLLIQSVFFISCLFLMMWELKLVFIPILIKMGIPPFHFWLMNILSYLKTFSFIFMMTIHKVFPLWFFSMVIVGSYSIILIASLLLLGSMIILQMIKIYYLLMVSSMVHSGWLLMGFSLNPLMGSYYWFFYSGFLSLFFILQKMEMKFYDLNQNFNTSFVFLSISGLPPFCFFWLKVMVMLFFLEKSVLISGLILISSVMSLSAYFRGFIFSLALNKSVFTALSPFVCVYALMGSF